MLIYNLNRVAILKDKKNKEPLGIITEEENVYQYIRQRPETNIRCR